MMDSQGDTGAESEGYKKQTATSTDHNSRPTTKSPQKQQQRNNPSEGETNCYIKPATETQTNNQVIILHGIHVQS